MPPKEHYCIYNRKNTVITGRIPLVQHLGVLGDYKTCSACENFFEKESYVHISEGDKSLVWFLPFLAHWHLNLLFLPLRGLDRIIHLKLSFIL